MFFSKFILATVATAMFIGSTALAADATKVSTHDGKVVSISADKLLMTSKTGKEHSHALTTNAKVTCDGKECKSADLKPGTRIRVTTDGVDNKVVLRIEAIDKNREFANNRHIGEVVSITGTKLVMVNEAGEEHSHTLTADSKVCCDGKECKSADLKPGMRIRITTEGLDNKVALRIEAIDKNREFASDPHDGKVVSVTDIKLVMTNEDGKEHSHALNTDSKITCDGAVCKSTDLKRGMRIRVTSDNDDDSPTAIRIEAIDKNTDFASI